MSYSRFEVVKIPFPFTDRTAEKPRPALVLSNAETFNHLARHSVLGMITSAKHSAWPLDVPITELEPAGLPAPSVVRMKLFTLDHRLILARLGKLAPADQASVARALEALLGAAAPARPRPRPLGR